IRCGGPLYELLKSGRPCDEPAAFPFRLWRSHDAVKSGVVGVGVAQGLIVSVAGNRTTDDRPRRTHAGQRARVGQPIIATGRCGEADRADAIRTRNPEDVRRGWRGRSGGERERAVDIDRERANVGRGWFWIRGARLDLPEAERSGNLFLHGERNVAAKLRNR